MEFKATVKIEPQIYEAGGFSMPKRFVMVFLCLSREMRHLAQAKNERLSKGAARPSAGAQREKLLPGFSLHL